MATVSLWLVLLLANDTKLHGLVLATLSKQNSSRLSCAVSMNLTISVDTTNAGKVHRIHQIGVSRCNTLIGSQVRLRSALPSAIDDRCTPYGLNSAKYHPL